LTGRPTGYGINYRQELAFVWVLLPFMFGIVTVYSRASLFLLYYNWCAAGLLFSCLLFINLFYVRIKAYRFKFLIGLLFCLFWYVAGSLNCMLHHEAIRPDHFSKSGYILLKGRVLDEPQYKTKTVRFKAEIGGAYVFAPESGDHKDQSKDRQYLVAKKVSGLLMLHIRQDTAQLPVLRYGDEFLVRAKINAIPAPASRTSFDYRSYLAAQHIYHQAFAGSSKIKVLNSNTGNPVLRFAFQFREQQLNFYRRVIGCKSNLDFASALILGYRAELDPEMLNVYSKTGTIHALSVSGMHVGIVYLILSQLLRFMDRKRWMQLIRSGIVILCIMSYALLTGFSPAVCRSAVMLSVLIIGRTYNRQANGFNIIAFTAFLMLAGEPFLIWDIGFQLSFLAVLGLVWLQPMIEGWWSFENKWLRQLWSALAMSLAAQVTTFPFCIWYFHLFPVCFLISNLFIMLPLAILMYLGIAILVFRAVCLVPVFEWLTTAMNDGLSVIARLPFSSISGIWISRVQLILLCMFLLCLLQAFSGYNKRLLFSSLLLLLTCQLTVAVDFQKAAHQREVLTFKLPDQEIKAVISGFNVVFIASRVPVKKEFDRFLAPVMAQLKIRKMQWRLLDLHGDPEKH